MPPIHVVIVDDHSVVRIGIKTFLDTVDGIEVVGEAGGGEQALQVIEATGPDVVLMDLLMPGMDGVETTQLVKKKFPAVQVIILTSYHQDENIFPAIRNGAISYVLKDIDPDDLAEVIRKAVKGQAVLNSRVATRLVQEFRGEQHDEQNLFTELTERELDVLRLIGQGKNNQEIANQLFISEKTVKTHLSNILNKLHLNDRTQAAVLAWQSGLIQRNEG
ncbi:MAG: response regulator transcription factor [Anaerolineaceae bacterium]|nr:response regulator transcription factor [Anaerolineaceae bacterium]